MKKIHLMGLILILVISTLIGCASSAYISRGSTKKATLEGTFSGKLSGGSCRIDIFELSDGTQRFEGNFVGDAGGTSFFKGTMTGNQLTGDFDLPEEGHLSGTQTADGNQIKGNFQFTGSDPDSGTWQATRK